LARSATVLAENPVEIIDKFHWPGASAPRSGLRQATKQIE
jgi:hypothetical protein